MGDPLRRDHWNGVYSRKAENEVSWFQESPEVSLALLTGAAFNPSHSIIDVGGGLSRLVDALVGMGCPDVSVLDLSRVALDQAALRLGAAAGVTWIEADITDWKPDRTYDFWHDRAVLHFLTEEADRQAYLSAMRAALAPGGRIVIGAFAPDGPEKCSGLVVRRYDAAALSALLGEDFAPIEERRHGHRTPGGAIQNFQFASFRRIR